MRAGAADAATTVFEAVAATLAQAGVTAHHRLCCALSGGVDSVTLLDALDALRERFGFTLEAVHVHHGLSPAADDWQDFCAGLCQRRAIALHTFRVDVARSHPHGLEAAARAARHAALARVACDWLALGHHRDDQAETVLFRLLRGAGVQGAAAMGMIEAPQAHARAGRLRPLLRIGRETLLAHARARGLAWVDDASNTDPRFSRNDLRHRLLPAIETAFPAARATLARAAAHFREAASLLDELAEIDAAACGCGQDAGVFERAALLALSQARLANLLRRELRRRGSLPPPAARLSEAIRQLRTVEGPLLLPLGELACHSYRGRVWLAPAQEAALRATPWQPQAGRLAWAGGEIHCQRVTGAGVAAAALERADACRFIARPPGLRLRLPGRPLKNFKSLCQESGIPAWLRERLPVLEVDDQAAWIGGLGVDAGFACAPGQAGWALEWLPGAARDRAREQDENKARDRVFHK
ncbi:MAG: tRNA lysidine(34) synthetase TilS [Azoarcus sp.]|jgi:tRNA(Ile)-lysidine synthase|nr:tRNA lysidine(34) synthetase TilS [Azoarcus sp.]